MHAIRNTMNELHLRSIALVAALKLQGFSPISAEPDSTNRADFIYARTPELLAALDAYKYDTMAVSPRLFAQAMHDVKTQYLPHRY
jgi:hypothetical protein